ncbi:MAG TPA: type II secretion system protein GspE, partial [Deltaproteobacteria bacterium]|nr:type II secretion system protein GspE [Deltaproteobacteria bacterium]
METRSVKRLGELLLRESLISVEQLDKALEDQSTTGSSLGSSLVKLGYISESDLMEFLSRQFGVPAVDPTKLDIDQKIIELIPSQMIQKYLLVPIALKGNTLSIAMADPSNHFIIDDIRFLTRKNIQVNVATESSIIAVIQQHFDPSTSLEDVIGSMDDEEIDVVSMTDDFDLDSVENEAEQAPVVKLVNLILMDAIKKGASDIHIEPYEKMFRVRFRIDGVLYEIMKPPLKLKNALISRIKIMSRL